MLGLSWALVRRVRVPWREGVPFRPCHSPRGATQALLVTLGLTDDSGRVLGPGAQRRIVPPSGAIGIDTFVVISVLHGSPTRYTSPWACYVALHDVGNAGMLNFRAAVPRDRLAKAVALTVTSGLAFSASSIPDVDTDAEAGSLLVHRIESGTVAWPEALVTVSVSWTLVQIDMAPIC